MKLYCLGPVAPRNTTVLTASNANPIVLTLNAALGTGNNALNPAVDVLTISGALGNTNANGSYAPGAYLVNSPTNITLLNKAGNGAYTGSGIASAPQQVIYAATFPSIPGVSDVTKVNVARILFAPLSSGTGTIMLGTVGLNQSNGLGIFRFINPPPTTGIMDYYDLELDGTDTIPLVEYCVDAAKPGTEAVITSFWIR